MGKLLKILITIVVLVVLLVVAAIIVIPLVVDPNDYKGEIAAQVKKATGRELLIGGDLGLSVFPWLGLELNDLRLNNAPGFGDEPFAAVKHAQVKAKLLPLLSKTLEVSNVRVEGLELNLAKAKDGRTNWDDLAGAGEIPEKPTAEKPGAGPGLEGLAIGGVEVADARVVWDDQANNQRFEVEEFFLKTGAISPGRPVDLELAFNLDSAQPVIKGRVDLEGQVKTDATMQRLSVSPLTIKVENLQAESLSGEVQLASKVDADLAQQRYRLDDIKLALSLKGEGLPDAGVQAELLAGLVVDLLKETLALNDLRLTAGELKVNGTIQGEKIKTEPHITGDLKVAEFSPRSVMQQMGQTVPVTADPNVLNRLALALHLDSSPQRVALEKLAITLDDTQVKGKVRLQPPSKPGVHFELDVDAIDLDRYLPPPVEVESAQATAAPKAGQTESAAQTADQLFPVDTLRGLHVDGRLKVGKLTINKLKAQGIQLLVKAKDGKIQLDDEVNSFYGGSVTGSIGVDVAASDPKLAVDQHAKKIQAGPLLTDLIGKDTLTGLGQFNATLNARGQTPGALKQTLGGNLDFKFADGTVKGFNLSKMLRDTKARFKGKPVTPSDEPEQMDFSELSASANISKGVLVNNDLHAQSPLLRVKGAGEVNLGADSLDYILTPTIVGTLQGQGGKSLEELKGVPIPIRFTGALAKPDYSIDWKQVLLAAQKTKLKDKTEKVQKKLEEKLEKQLQDKVPGELQDQLKGKLKGLF